MTDFVEALIAAILVVTLIVWCIRTMIVLYAG